MSLLLISKEETNSSVRVTNVLVLFSAEVIFLSYAHNSTCVEVRSQLVGVGSPTMCVQEIKLVFLDLTTSPFPH